MKGIGWIVILMALLGVTFLVVKDLEVLQGDRAGETVVEPLERAQETADVVQKTQDRLQESLNRIGE